MSPKGAGPAGRLRIRAARPDDIPDLVRLWRDLLAYHRGIGERDVRVGPAPSEGRQFIKDHIGSRERLCLVAESDGATVGFLIATMRVRSPAFGGWRYGHIYDAYVEASARGRGAGTALVEAAFRWFRHHGARRVQLQVRARNRLGTRFWRGLGFLDLAITMERPLAGPLHPGRR